MRVKTIGKEAATYDETVLGNQLIHEYIGYKPVAYCDATEKEKDFYAWMACNVNLYRGKMGDFGEVNRARWVFSETTHGYNLKYSSDSNWLRRFYEHIKSDEQAVSVFNKVPVTTPHSEQWKTVVDFIKSAK
jgi:hypothetical protein